MIMADDPHRRWRKSEVFAALEEHGWLPEGRTPDKQLTNRITEMVRRGELERHGQGVIALPSARADLFHADDIEQQTGSSNGSTAHEASNAD